MLTLTFLLVTVVATLKVVEIAPPGTVTVAGTVALAGLLLARLTIRPPGGATLVSVTVPTELVPPTTVDGFSTTDESAAEGAGFTVMVADLLTPP